MAKRLRSTNRFCKCPNEHCFDCILKCGSLDPDDIDSEGYPHKARRRLTNEENGMIQDIDDGQWFKVKKIKGGKRLVPHFEGRIDWNSTKGFAAMCLILSCLGAESEYVLWDDTTGKEMTEEEWLRRKFKKTDKPPVRHCVCEQVVTSTDIHNLRNGQNIGCSCNSSHANHWRHRRSEVVQWGKERGFEVLTTEKGWVYECHGNEYCPKLQCVKCKEVVTSTDIHNLRNGQNIGCSCNSSHANHWRHRRSDVVQWGKERGFEVLTTEEQWIDECNGNVYYPKLQCVKCKEVVTSTNIDHLKNGHIGCRCNSTQANHWRHRRSEVVQWGKERGFEVLTTEEQWIDECDGKDYCPKLKCVKCKQVVTSTNIDHLKNGHIGCCCYNKTEAKFRQWLEKKYPDATIKTQFNGPKTDKNGQTHFDFHVTFPYGFEVLIELDGLQHFFENAYHFSKQTCERDLIKEKWAITKGLSIIRVLQDDVWNDRFGWDTYVSEKIKAARSCEPRVFVPDDAREYHASTSVYVRMRTPNTDF